MLSAGVKPLIYFNRDFHGYYIIGEIDDIWNTLYPTKDEKEKLDVSLFTLKVYAGNQEYFQRLYVPLTAKEYRKKFPKLPLIPPQPLSSIASEIYKYTEESIKNKKDHFLFCLASQLAKPNKSGFSPIDLYLAVLPLIDTKYEKLFQDEKEGVFSKFFHDNIWEEIMKEEDSLLMTHQEYYRALVKAYHIVHHFREKTKLIDSEIECLNNVISSIPPLDNPFKDFAYSFLHNFIDTLQNKKLLKICPACERIFPYRHIKIYCSNACAKHSRYKRYYSRHRNEILPKAKELMRTLRAFYKEKGIRK